MRPVLTVVSSAIRDMTSTAVSTVTSTAQSGRELTSAAVPAAVAAVASAARESLSEAVGRTPRPVRSVAGALVRPAPAMAEAATATVSWAARAPGRAMSAAVRAPAASGEPVSRAIEAATLVPAASGANMGAHMGRAVDAAMSVPSTSGERVGRLAEVTAQVPEALVSVPGVRRVVGAASHVSEELAALAVDAPARVPVVSAVPGVARAVGSVSGLATGAVGAVGRVSAALASAVVEIADAGPRRGRRRVWAGDGRMHADVRGLTGSGEQHKQVASAVTSALTAIKGVRWAEINAVTRQVVVAFDEDGDGEEVDLDLVMDTIEAVEEAQGTDGKDFTRQIPDNPGDPAAVQAAAVTLIADVMGFWFAWMARLAMVPELPRITRLPVILAESQPRLRRALERRLGRPATELSLALANSAAYAVTHDAFPLAVDAGQRALKLLEAHARRAVWERREPELTSWALPSTAKPLLPRPCPLPLGPIEIDTDRTALAALLGAGGAFAWTRDLSVASDLLLATVPKAARIGRESFAATLGFELMRRDLLVMDTAALRRLDRISAVVIDSVTLCAPRPRILSAVATSPGFNDAEVWRTSAALLGGLDLAAFKDLLARPKGLQGDGWRLLRAVDAAPGQLSDPRGATLDLQDLDGRIVGRVRVGCGLDPMADAVMSAARGAVQKVLLTDHVSLSELMPWADDVLPTDNAGLADKIRALQSEGHGVLLISNSDDPALAAADVGVTVLSGESVCWSADVICGTRLEDAWRVLRALKVARYSSERSARLAVGGALLGALLATAGPRRTNRRLTPEIAPAHSAAAIALAGAALSARKVARQPAPAPMPRADWHAMSKSEVLARLRADNLSSGLAEAEHRWTAADAAHLLTAIPGVTTLVVRPVRGTAALASAVTHELRDPLTPVLALGAAASAVVGSGVDAILVGSVMVGNAMISGVQRLRAERALSELLMGERLYGRRVVTARQSANGSWGVGPVELVPAERLVPGDIIVLEPSEVVPADARLLDADGLEVDEASLTGESLSVTKSPEPVPGADLPDRTCMVYEGTTVVAGRAHAVVVAVGAATEAGRAAATASRTPGPAGVQGRLAELARVTVPATGIGGLAVTGLSLLHGLPLRQAVSSGIAIAVAAVPEGLPLVATAAQLAAARRLSRLGILVRSSRTLEALGRVDIFCFDKTGTLTEGRLSVTRLAAYDRELEFDDTLGRHLLRTAARACPRAEGQAVRQLPHATDRAIIEAAQAHGVADLPWRLIQELPFETNRGYAASLGVNPPGVRLAVKGAPEVILERSANVLVNPDTFELVPFVETRRKAAQELIQKLAGEGLRVIAVAEAVSPNGTPPDHSDLDALATELTLVGFVGIADPPRASAAETVRRLSGSGVRVTMITGDHPATASAIARQLGIPDHDQILTGAELTTLSKRARLKRVEETTVFARVSPEQKVQIVQALQDAGHTVAMTGDGTNDAAAIRLANVGIGVSGRGSTAARSAADLVLADPDPARLVDSLAEGRALWSRVRDAVSILVGGNAGEVIFTLLGTALRGRAPLGTRQLLLVNMMTDMLPALAVALAEVSPSGNGEQADHETGEAEPDLGVPNGATSLDASLFQTLGIRGGATALGASVAWHVGRMTGRDRRASTMGLAALVGTQLGQTLLMGRRSPMVVITSVASAAALFAVVETPGVSHFFGCTPLGPIAWTVVAVSSGTATLGAALAPRLLESVLRPAE